MPANDLLNRMFWVMKSHPGFDIEGHLPTLYALARRQGGNIVELGTRAGNSALALLAGAMESNGSLTSYDVDASCKAWALRTMGLPAGHLALKRWKFVCKSSMAGFRDWKDRTISLLFIDTTHDYASTLKELTLWAPKVSPRGVICGHDYADSRRRKTFGVDRAVAEHQRQTKSARSLYAIRHDNGLFILWPR